MDDNHHPFAGLRTLIVGNKFRSVGAISALHQSRPGDYLVILREKDNKFDTNALKVHLKKYYNTRDEARSFVGYIPAKDAAKISPYLDKQNITRIDGELDSVGNYPRITLLDD